MSSRTPDVTGDPRTVDEARYAVERSRERISSTLDQLEDRIVEKKHELQDRVDVLRPVRVQIIERPFTAIAVAAGVGALLGSLGGSHDEHEHDDDRASRRRRAEGYLGDEDRAELREWRRARRDRLRAHSSADDAEEHDSRFSDLRHQLMGAVTTAIGSALTARVRDFAMNAGGGNGRTRSR